MLRNVNASLNNLWKSLSRCTRRMRGHKNHLSSQVAAMEERVLLAAGIEQQPDPLNVGQTMVVITGTSGDDLIYVYAIGGGYRRPSTAR